MIMILNSLLKIEAPEALAQLGNCNQQFFREKVGLITGPGGWELFPDGFMKHRLG